MYPSARMSCQRGFGASYRVRPKLSANGNGNANANANFTFIRQYTELLVQRLYGGARSWRR